MARALMGHVSRVGNATEHALAHEVMRLRRRVAELEAELVTLREQRADAAHTLELELHQLAGVAEPALA